MIVITGASDGLGKELARLYKQAGKTVVNISRHKCEWANDNFLHDLRKSDEVLGAADEIKAISEPLEALINCAGVIIRQPLDQLTQDDIEKVVEINVTAPMLLTARLIDRIKKDGADIVNVASTVGTRANPNEAIYGTSKWALRGFSANLQLELKQTSCRVISFCPGGMKTKLFEKGTGKDITDQGMWMDPGDIALCLKQLLDLPKNMEVSEIIINRKSV